MKFLTVILIFCITLAVAQAKFNRDEIQQQWQFGGGNRRALFRNGQHRVFHRNLYGRRSYNGFVGPFLPLPIDVDRKLDVIITPSRPEVVIQPLPQNTPGPKPEATLVEAVVEGTPLEATEVTEAVEEPDVKEPEEEAKSAEADVSEEAEKSESQ